MLKYLKGLSVQGRKFTAISEFDFWSKDTSRVSLLYGRNGSGKSTISDAFTLLKNDEGSDFTTINPISFSDGAFVNEDKNKIFVFNEKFVDKNIKIEDDGIGSIVMFGRQAELDNQIRIKEELLAQICEKIEQDEALCGEYDDKKNDKSPKYYFNKCESELKSVSGWARQDSLLRGSRQNSNVNLSVITDIVENHVSDKSIEDLVEEFERKKRLYDSVTSSSEKITQPVKICTLAEVDLFAKSTLMKKIEKKEFTDREKKIFDFIQQKGISMLNDAKHFFQKDENDFCPYCFQPMNDDYKKILMDDFKKVLNQEVEDYVDELKRLKKTKESFSPEIYSQLDQSQVNSVIASFNSVNSEIEKLNQIIDERINNVYQEFRADDYHVCIDSAIEKYNEELRKLENKRNEFNSLIDGKNALKEELIDINKKIACKKIVADYKKFKQQEIAQKNAETNKNNDIDRRKVVEQEKEDLEGQKKNIRIAQEHINKLLKYVYFDANRMSISAEDGIYRIKSCGQAVRPNKISCGERNILALCYYFTDLFSQKDESSVYSNPYLLVIDDPISSFDRENQVGVISLLKYELNNFMSCNEDTKCLLMTHDLKTFYDLQKMVGEITKKLGCSGDCNELSQSCLTPFLFKQRNEYSNYLKDVYEYANNRKDSVDSYIGNTLRKVVEFYSTFLFKLGIEEVSLNRDVLALIEKKEHRDYFENLMYRLVLHGESHFEERVKTLDDFCNGMSIVEKKRIARDVLCFLYLMNPLHVKRHLDGCRDVESTLNHWCNLIG